jgi:hypothetical protein
LAAPYAAGSSDGFQETAAQLLAEESVFVSDWEIVGPQIAGEISGQSGQLLADARADYDAFERLRVQAVDLFGRADPAMCWIGGVLTGYLLLVIEGPGFVPLAAAKPGLGMTPLILATLVISFAIRWMLTRRRRAALMRSVSVAYHRWTEVLRDQVLRPFIVEKRNDEVRNPRLFDTIIGEKSRHGLSRGASRAALW